MSNVTYLMGAGASAECLPVYNNFKERFSKFFTNLKYANEKLEKFGIKPLDELVKTSETLKNELQFHNTPDLVAKKYYHSSSDAYLTYLKMTLSIFIMYEQMIGEDEKKALTDKRYDALLASILIPEKNKIRILGDIKILTWNYDLQFEKAYGYYSKGNLFVNQENLQSFPKISKAKGRDFNLSEFSILHLNGVAYQHSDASPLTRYYPSFEEMAELIKATCDNIDQNHRDYHNGIDLLQFAWENIGKDFSINDENVVLANAHAVASITDVLVVIGYSFPLFNRAIDLSLLKSMKNLKRIYIQSPQSIDIKNFLEEATKLEDKCIVDLGFWNSFYIPDWLLENKNDGPTVW